MGHNKYAYSSTRTVQYSNILNIHTVRTFQFGFTGTFHFSKELCSEF